MSETTIFQKNIRRLMIKNKLNQAQLSRKAGLSEVTISRYVNGSRLPSSRAIPKLTKALNCTTNDLFDESEEVSKLELIMEKMFSSLNESEINYLISMLKNKI